MDFSKSLLLAPSILVLVAVDRRGRLIDHTRLNICRLLIVAISEAELDAVLMGEYGR